MAAGSRCFIGGAQAVFASVRLDAARRRSRAARRSGRAFQRLEDAHIGLGELGGDAQIGRLRLDRHEGGRHERLGRGGLKPEHLPQQHAFAFVCAF
ncbi:MAG: hypothetical protein WDN08_06090 [Rhizomicrobium sp.]